MHNADYAVARCLSVCPFRLSVTHRCIMSTSLNISSKFFYLQVAPPILVFPYQKVWQYSNGDPRNGGVECKEVWKNRDFRPISRFVFEMMQVRAIFTIEGEYVTVPKLSTGAIPNDLEWPLTQISRSRYYSTWNNSKMILDRAILAMEDQ